MVGKSPKLLTLPFLCSILITITRLGKYSYAKWYNHEFQSSGTRKHKDSGFHYHRTFEAYNLVVKACITEKTRRTWMVHIVSGLRIFQWAEGM